MEDNLERYWRKSSYSGNGGSDCVEVGNLWRKSSHSGNGGADCVEVASRDGVLVRDSKDRDGAPVMVAAAEWRALVGRIRHGR
jgi:hypothetical protein